MTCWSCERAAGEAATCSYCGALQPPNASRDHFAVFGLPRRFEMDSAEAEQRFRDLSRQIHPDRFAKADPRARRASLQHSVQLNEAWRTLKDPVRRAEYLLRLAGYDLTAQEGRASASSSTAAATAESALPRITASPMLLADILELREELADARTEGDDPRVQRLAAAMQRRLEASLAQLTDIFSRMEAAGTSESNREGEISRAGAELIAIRYYRRFLDEVAVHDEGVAANDGGTAHA